jgi:hypothetical protein
MLDVGVDVRISDEAKVKKLTNQELSLQDGYVVRLSAGQFNNANRVLFRSWAGPFQKCPTV